VGGFPDHPMTRSTDHPILPSVLPFDQAFELVERYCLGLKPTQTEPVPLLEGLGRVLAEPVLADRDFPPFVRATRDGYALRCADLKTIPMQLKVVGQVRAGDSHGKFIADGEAVEIMTGAPVPAGADAVVMVEYTSAQQDSVTVQRSCSPGENIVPRGSEARAGAPMLAAGTRIGFSQIGVASAVGKTLLRVNRKPRVAILSTGDELVEASATPSPHQIRNSNSYSLAAQVALAGGEPWRLPIAPDDQTAIRTAIEQGLSADLLLLSGGVSMGKFDFVEQALADLQARFFFTGALIQPGKPVVFGEAHARNQSVPTPFFGLPGNPISTMVTFDLFARPVLHTLSGGAPVRLPTVKARLAREIKTKTGLTRFLPATLKGALYDPSVEVVAWHGSGDLQSAARANCYVIVPSDREMIASGEMINILLRS
jgi:molybdopterin molybdotransferase